MKRLLLVLIAVISLTISPLVLAVDYNGLGGVPANPDPNNPRSKSIFIYTLNPTETKKDGIRVVNNSDQFKVVELYATDSEISSGGSFACKQKVDERKDVGSWIVFSKNELRLGPGEEQIVPFTITAPEQVDVGEHDGCAVIQEKKSEPDIQQGGVNISLRSALRVIATIPGDITKDLDLNSFAITQKDNLHIFKVGVINKGNVSVDANIQVYAKNLLGRTGYQNGGIYPVISKTKPLELNYEMPDSFWGGLYTTKAVLQYDNDPNKTVGQQQNYNTEETLNGQLLFVMPDNGALLIYFAVILGAILVFRYFKGRRDEHAAATKDWVEYIVKKSDTIKSLAEKRDTDWKLIAKTNSLKPPYHLEPKSALLLPPLTEQPANPKKVHTETKAGSKKTKKTAGKKSAPKKPTKK